MLNIFASPRTGKIYTPARIIDLLIWYPALFVVSDIRF